MKKHIPNLITSRNVASGCFGIVFEFEGYHDTALMFMCFALLFDFMDGAVARLLNVSSPMGKELDSLADMITFGLLPGVMMFRYMLVNSCDPKICTGLIANEYFPFTAFIITIYSAWRLAKFNIDTRQSDRFFGLPTPANAIFIATLPYLLGHSPFIDAYLNNPKVLLLITLFMSWLLVADIPLIALKFKNLSFKENTFRFLLILTSCILLIFLQFAAVPLIIFFYIALSIIENFFSKNEVS